MLIKPPRHADRDFEFDIRMRPAKRREHARQRAEREVVGGTEAHAASQTRRAELRLGVGHRLQDHAGVDEHGFAVGGERERMGIAYEQPPADVFLQPPDVFAHAGLRQAELAAGIGETVRRGHRRERVQPDRIEHEFIVIEFYDDSQRGQRASRSPIGVLKSTHRAKTRCGTTLTANPRHIIPSSKRMTPKNSHTALLWIVAVGFFMQALDTTIVNTALPSIAHSLHAQPLAMQPIVVAYTLTMALLTPASGWLADRFGTRRVYFVAILLFVIGSLCCANAQSLNQLIVARVIQGIGGSMLLPIGRLAVLRSVTGEAYVSALAVISIAGQVGPILGPTLGGWFVESFSWHWIFLINVPIGAVGLFAVHRFLPDDALGRRPAVRLHRLRDCCRSAWSRSRWPSTVPRKRTRCWCRAACSCSRR